MIGGGGFTALFPLLKSHKTLKMEDLINITPTEAVTFTATAVLEHNRHSIAFEGSDRVRILAIELFVRRVGRLNSLLMEYR